MLEGEGFRIGPDAWALRLTYATFESRQRLSRHDRDREGQPVPAVRLNYTLLAPDGSTAWSGSEEHLWSAGGSKYLLPNSGKIVSVGAGGVVTASALNFQGQSAETAITAEVLDGIAALKRLSPKMPRILLKTEGGYQALPVQAEFSFAGR